MTAQRNLRSATRKTKVKENDTKAEVAAEGKNADRKKSSRGNMLAHKPKKEGETKPQTSDNTPAGDAPTAPISDAEIIARTVGGAASKSANNSCAIAGTSPLLVDPIRAALYPTAAATSCPFLLEYAAQREATECAVVAPARLLQEANTYFAQYNRDEKQRNRQAWSRIQQMKKANEKGGDKDGFRYVIPKNAQKLASQLMATATGAPSDAAELSSHFMGDGVEDTATMPIRRKKVRKHTMDDFYQFQVHRNWARRAEGFLMRGRMARQMLQERNKKRTTKKL